jgi:predicted HTH transcriptional regulator
VKYFTNGSDGVPSFTLDTNSSSSAQEIPLFSKRELLYPVPHSTTSGQKRTTKLSPKQQQEIIAQHANGQSLRELAGAFGVSYETIRTTIKRHQDSKTISENYSKPEAKGDF